MSGINKDGWKAMLKRARRGDGEAQCDVAMYYQSGYVSPGGEVIVRRRPKLAVSWYQKAAVGGQVRAQDQLGVLLSEGDGGPRDLEQALYWAQKAAAQRDGQSAHNLATIYRDMGRHRSAYRWYKKAATLGEFSSIVEVGIALYLGIGVRSDPVEACRCFRRVLEREIPTEVSGQDQEDARLWMGIAHLQGVGVRRSAKKARALLEAADADCDNAAAQGVLRVLGRKLSG